MINNVNNIMTLCAEIVEKAKSGHPGAPLGLSQFMHILYTEFLNLNPDDPGHINRDIVVMSNGHACAIQYVMNYLIGYISLDDLKSFRQLNSITPGHPEKNRHGIEVTTGPLGQGVASSVGFGISCRMLQKYGVNSQVYCIFGDGCYQEGISQESFSLCTRLGLNNITFVYDFNRITIDGSTELSMNENVKMRFESLDFEVFEIPDDPEMIRSALQAKPSRPKVIILHTRIGKDSELEGNFKAHGSPLGEENVRKLKDKLGVPQDSFYISEGLIETYEKAKQRMRDHIRKQSVRDGSFADKRVLDTIKSLGRGEELHVDAFYNEPYKSENLATRVHFGKCLNAIQTNRVLISGAADLTSSINSRIENTMDFDSKNFGTDSYIRFGIREHSMFGVMNGIAAHGIFVPVSGTFLNFAAYGLASIRIACIDRLKVIYVLTHDSIKLGEDGPTHQPVEILPALRAMPNLVTIRPCDGRETRSAMAIAIKEKGPVALILSRQVVNDTPFTQAGNEKYCGTGAVMSTSDVDKGAYYLHKVEGHKVILIATGSEVELALQVKDFLNDLKVSVVSMMSFELFERQPDTYKSFVIDRSALRVSIEALSTFGWSKYSDIQIGLDEFGRSAPGQHVYEFFGFTPESIGSRIRTYMNKHT